MNKTELAFVGGELLSDVTFSGGYLSELTFAIKGVKDAESAVLRLPCFNNGLSLAVASFKIKKVKAFRITVYDHLLSASPTS